MALVCLYGLLRHPASLEFRLYFPEYMAGSSPGSTWPPNNCHLPEYANSPGISGFASNIHPRYFGRHALEESKQITDVDLTKENKP